MVNAPSCGCTNGRRRPEPRQAQEYLIGTYVVYSRWFLPERYVAGKGSAVNWNEGLHSVRRRELNRLMRQTKGYTKNVKMLVYSLKLVCWQQ